MILSVGRDLAGPSKEAPIGQRQICSGGSTGQGVIRRMNSARARAHGTEADLSAPDPVGERQCRLLSATPALAFGRGAKLPAFRGIDPMQLDVLPSDFQCVAVDHAGNAGQEIGIGVGGGKKGEQKEGEKSAHWAGRLLAKVTSRTLTMPPAHWR